MCNLSQLARKRKAPATAATEIPDALLQKWNHRHVREKLQHEIETATVLVAPGSATLTPVPDSSVLTEPKNVRALLGGDLRES